MELVNGQFMVFRQVEVLRNLDDRVDELEMCDLTTKYQTLQFRALSMIPTI